MTICLDPADHWQHVRLNLWMAADILQEPLHKVIDLTTEVLIFLGTICPSWIPAVLRDEYALDVLWAYVNLRMRGGEGE